MTRSDAQRKATMRNWYIMRLRGAWYILAEVGINAKELCMSQQEGEANTRRAQAAIDELLDLMGAETQTDRIRKSVEEVYATPTE